MIMTTEQKAKAYDEVVKRAESLYKVAEPMSGCNVIIETLLPELKESDDERIRKELILFFTKRAECTLNGLSSKDILAWLEKQGEQKPIDKVGVWSEEDEELYNDLLDTYFYNDEDYPEDTYKHMLKKVLDWMNKRAKYLIPQKQEWSEEEHQIIKDAASVILDCVNTVETKKEEERLEELADKLQNLRPKPKKEWSEEDEEISKAIIDKIAGSTLSVDLQRAICWVRNIKNRV